MRARSASSIAGVTRVGLREFADVAVAQGGFAKGSIRLPECSFQC